MSNITVKFNSRTDMNVRPQGGMNIVPVGLFQDIGSYEQKAQRAFHANARAPIVRLFLADTFNDDHKKLLKKHGVVKWSIEPSWETKWFEIKKKFKDMLPF